MDLFAPIHISNDVKVSPPTSSREMSSNSGVYNSTTEWLFGNSTLSSQNDFQIKSIQQKLKNIQEKKIHSPVTAPNYYGNVSRIPTVYDSVETDASLQEQESFVTREGMDCDMEPVRPVDPNSIGGKLLAYLYYPYDYTKIGCRYIVENITSIDKDVNDPVPGVHGSQIDYVDMLIVYITGRDKNYFKNKLFDSNNNPENTLPPKPSNGVLANIVETDDASPENKQSFVGSMKEGYVNTDITNDYTTAIDDSEIENKYSKKKAKPTTTPPLKLTDKEKDAIEQDTNALTEYCVRIFMLFFTIPLTYYLYDILVHYNSIAFTSLIEFEKNMSRTSGENSGPAFYYRHNFHPIVYVDTILKYVSMFINQLNVYPKLTFIIILYFAFKNTRYFVNSFMYALSSMITGNVSDVVYYMILYSLLRHKIFDAQAFTELAMGPWVKSVVFMFIFFFGSFILWVVCLSAFASMTQLLLNILFMLTILPLFKDTALILLQKLSFGYISAGNPSNYSEIHDDMPCDFFAKVLDSYVFPYIFHLLFFVTFIMEGLKSFLYYRYSIMRRIMFWINMGLFCIVFVSMFFVHRKPFLNKI